MSSNDQAVDHIAILAVDFDNVIFYKVKISSNFIASVHFWKFITPLLSESVCRAVRQSDKLFRLKHVSCYIYLEFFCGKVFYRCANIRVQHTPGKARDIISTSNDQAVDHIAILAVDFDNVIFYKVKISNFIASVHFWKFITPLISDMLRHG